MTHPRSRWEEIVEANPDHSTWYVERFRAMARDGKDVDGEARLVDAMLPRGARILDAGSGPGRVGSALAARGHTVVGVDVDPVLVAAAEEDHPGSTWLVGDLVDMDLPARGITEPFDLVVCAGNVMTFLADGTHEAALARMHAHLAPGGRVVVGFGAGRGYAVQTFLTDARRAGLVPDVLLATWDLRPYEPDSDFVVAVLREA
ncbi:bifunctional 2-polyprenyl-6-hydroxyphenol methylase/3-demethylubiquinol 3-O-methyltransferase UbiG [Sanguibacter sp. HDW7]|uniref:class I SAM-dependent methyltransferase n=1 Tax=Sanguibacter sp. HDW7 TaxID=2714931 RepID=UPI001F0F0874|nr:class I SAM-dependent methyltransferase [Sanguibacter sp. HDW7]